MVIGILEDERSVAETIESYIRRYFEGSEYENELEIRYFSNAFDLLENYRADYSVLFMDIQLRMMSGMEAAACIRQQAPPGSDNICDKPCAVCCGRLSGQRVRFYS